MVGPVTAGFIGWVCGKLGDKLLKHLVGDEKLKRDLDNAIEEWAKSLGKGRYVHPKALFPEVDASTATAERPEYCALQAKLLKNELPTKEIWHAVFMESWAWVKANIEGPQAFFCLKEEEAGSELEKLAEAAHAVCVQHEPVFKKAVIQKLDIIDSKIDAFVDRPPEKVKLEFPFVPSLHNQTPPEENFVGRKEELDTITEWYKNPEVRIGALIGWGGVGKSALVRKWYDSLEKNEIRPDGIFWWGFYRNAYLEQFLNALLRYVSGGQIEPEAIKGTWEKVERIKEYIGKGEYLIILDGLEQMQKGESGDEFGKMNHRECVEMLHYLADVPKAKGLCLITTRYRLKDLEDWENRGYKNKSLIDLSIGDARAMLKKRGVKGSDDDIKEVVERYKGHALSLTLLAGYLRKYHNGDIKQAPQVKFVLGDKKRFENVNKLLSRYAEKMSDAERVFLNIFSLFRQEVTERDFAGVFRKKIEGSKCNDVLIEMGELDFKDMIDGLVDWRLISCDEIKKTYTTHPLIKSYFESDFREKDRKLCHKRIYKYFGENAPKEANTLEAMQPLFEQVEHGCAAGLYDEAFDEVFYAKIERHEEHFIYHKLGAWETNLSLVKTFFPKGNISQMPLVSRKDAQSFLLNEAGLALLNTGRPKEAEEVFVKLSEMDTKGDDLTGASTTLENLTDLRFRTGEIESGLESAKKAIEMAEKAMSDDGIVASKAYLGWILYLLGRTEGVEKEFREADEICVKSIGHQDYSITEVFHIDFLLSMERIDEAVELTKENLDFCQRNNWINEIARCYRCLGAIERIRGDKEKAEKHFQEALEIARKVGMPALEIEALLERGRLCLDMGKYEDAIGDAEQILKICERTGFKLYEPEAEIIIAKAHLASALKTPAQCMQGQADGGRGIGEDGRWTKDDGREGIDPCLMHAGAGLWGQAEGYAKSAYEKTAGMKYRWAEGDGAHLLGEIYRGMGRKKEAREWIKKAVDCRREIKDPKVKESERMMEEG